MVFLGENSLAGDPPLESRKNGVSQNFLDLLNVVNKIEVRGLGRFLALAALPQATMSK